ncbi:protein PTST, chloroplastic isoform X2 [Andrographis paniculata]|uniref:protein PTST, chloroplastic isoform X2 n=1 Tax=Andrographis paniculata TaxID=175694 RepID=UPI0021E76DE6|nr:protein PTST, chloroplastic isoform X2 [Andrographis paniculata]
MECGMVSTASQHLLPRINMKREDKFQITTAGLKGKRLNEANLISICRNSPLRHERWRVFCDPISLEEEFLAVQSRNFSTDEVSDPDEPPAQPPSSEELKAWLANSERSNLAKKLSEANQYNRFLKRQLQEKEGELVKFKSELAIIEHEIENLVNLAKEIANYSVPVGSRKIKGKYIQYHLLSRLQVVSKKVEEQVKDVDMAQLKEVPISWSGMAESVQVMGTFDGWTQGEHLSPEYTGSYMTFSTTLMLKPGRYEIKFLVDGEWLLSPEFPSVGEGLMQNNLLVVE